MYLFMCVFIDLNLLSNFGSSKMLKACKLGRFFKKTTRPHLGPTPLAPLHSFASVYKDLHPFHATSVASIFHNLVASFGFTQAVGYLSSGSTLQHLKLSIFSFCILLLPTNDDGDIPFRVRQSYNSNPRALSLWCRTALRCFVGYNNSVA